MSKVTLGPPALGCVSGVEYAVVLAKNGVRADVLYRGEKANATTVFQKAKDAEMLSANRGQLNSFEIGLYELRPLAITQYKK